VRLHPGINMSSFSAEGLPGLLMAITIVFMFIEIFVPATVGAVLLGLWAITMGIAASVYVRAQRRDREDAERIEQAWRDLLGKVKWR
jgi:cadmium resistance protein CadD (predicted permease)